jgi:hypothetical protein
MTTVDAISAVVGMVVDDGVTCHPRSVVSNVCTAYLLKWTEMSEFSVGVAGHEFGGIVVEREQL